MAALPYMQLYVADYLADTPHLTTEEHGAYLLLLFSYWQTGKPLRVDRLAHTARLSNERWTSVQRSLTEFFKEVDGVWIHLRVEKDLEKVAAKSGKNSEAGKASAAARALAKQQLERLASEGNSANVGTYVERTLNERSTIEDTDTDTDTEKDQNQDQNLLSSGSKKPKKKKSGFELPSWIDRSSWDGFLEMRKLIKKPISENGMGLAVGKLQKLALEGHNPNDVLDQSTFYSWQGLFAIKEEFRNDRQTNRQGSGTGRPSLVDRVRQANAHLLDDEPPPIDERDWPEFDSIREINGSLVGPDD